MISNCGKGVGYRMSVMMTIQASNTNCKSISLAFTFLSFRSCMIGIIKTHIF